LLLSRYRRSGFKERDFLLGKLTPFLRLLGEFIPLRPKDLELLGFRLEVDLRLDLRGLLLKEDILCNLLLLLCVRESLVL